jgi:hypothetical protein
MHSGTEEWHHRGMNPPRVGARAMGIVPENQ